MNSNNNNNNKSGIFCNIFLVEKKIIAETAERIVTKVQATDRKNARKLNEWAHINRKLTNIATIAYVFLSLYVSSSYKFCRAMNVCILRALLPFSFIFFSTEKTHKTPFTSTGCNSKKRHFYAHKFFRFTCGYVMTIKKCSCRVMTFTELTLRRVKKPIR